MARNPNFWSKEIRTLRQEKGMLQRQLAKLAKVNRTTFAETAAHVDETRKTKRWAELCVELAQFARYQGHPEKEVEAAGVMMAVPHVMARFIGHGELPQAWVLAYPGDAWMKRQP